MAGRELEGLNVASVRLRDDPAHARVVVEVDLLNQLDRTAHVHATPRIVRYDPATRHLLVEFSDEHLDPELPSRVTTRPKFKAVDPGRRSTMRIRLPRSMHQLAAGSDPRVPGIATLPIYEAEEVEVLLAWSDTPFYPDTREGAPAEPGSVRSWQRGTAHGHGRRTHPLSEPGD